MEPNDLNPTRRSLVSRLRKWDDQESWQDFFTTYWKLIYSVAVKSGLTDEEAEDVVQETVLSIAKKMGDFKYDPAVCSFRGWLMHVTRLRIIDQLRKRPPTFQPKAVGDRNPASTATVDRVADPASLTLDSIWDDEWKRNTVDAAMQRVKRRLLERDIRGFAHSGLRQLR
jgi:RNA polymerase sigma-70 factor (ECF subfamily)